MDNTKDALDKARGDAQSLHRKIARNTTKRHAEIRAEAHVVGAQAQELGRAVKELFDAQSSDARGHLKDALTALEAANKEITSIAQAGDADAKARNRAALAQVRAATQKLSEAVAAKRAAALVKA